MSGVAGVPGEPGSSVVATAVPTVLAGQGDQPDDADLERRFGGLRRLYGDAGYRRLRAARVAVVGLGGVGSWTVEALARCGVRRLVLVDLDQVSESNINRQVQALGSTAGLPKAVALQRRIADIHPGCEVRVVEEFASADNWPGLLGSGDDAAVDAVVDACDQGHAKLALARWALGCGATLVVAGAAGGKREPQRVEVADLAEASHDPLLASLRQRLRREGAPRQGRIGLRCVFSRESVAAPPDVDCTVDGSLNCHGYGSTVTVTATFGMVAAAEVLRRVTAGPGAAG